MQPFTNPKAVEWSSDDAQTLKLFLASSIGVRALSLVLVEKPVLLDGADVNKTLVRNGEVKGFDRALESLTRLTYEQPEEAKRHEEYPDLDNEAAWNTDSLKKVE